MAIDPGLYRQIVDFLVHRPSLQDKKGREAVLSWAGLKNLLPYIDLSGAPWEFVTHLISQLEQYDAQPDQPSALVLLLRGIEELEIGQGNKAILQKFCQQLPDHSQRFVGPCPYRGLSMFREEDAKFFFGRETYTEKLVEAVQKQSFVAVISASGSGKSSVVYAGLIPRLRHQGNWLITSFRPGQQPLYNLSVVLIPLLEPAKSEVERLEEINKLTDKLKSGKITLTNVCEVIARKYPDSRLLLFADQFEELYTLCQDENERHRFLDELIDVLGVQTLVCVLTMRADFLGKALAYRSFADAFQNSDIILGRMNRDELRAAIEEPAKAQHVQIEGGLIERILDAVGDEPGNLPLLEFALTVLWNRQTSPPAPLINQVKGILTHAAYDAIGGVEKVLASYAEGIYNNLPQDEQERMQHIFTQLVRPGEGTEDTRHVTTRADVGEENWELFTKLADARLVVTNRSTNFSLPENQQTEVCTPKDTVEVAHETLITGWQRLREWMDADREFRMWQERLRQNLHEWEDADKIEDLSLPEIKVSQAEVHLKNYRDRLNERERTYIEISRTVRKHEREERELHQRQKELEERESIRHHRTRKWGILKNILLGLGILLLMLFLQNTGWLQFTQNAFMDAMMQIFRGEEPNMRRKIPSLVFLDIDEDTYQAWGEPLVARDRLLQLIKTAVEGNARVIVVDIFFTRKTPGLSGSNQDALHPNDQALYDYLLRYSDMCQTHLTAQGGNIHCPQILLIRDVRWSEKSACPEIRASFLDDAVNNSPDIHWGTVIANLESDRILHRVQLWQPVCNPDGEVYIIPSMPLLATASAVQPDDSPKRNLQDLQISLQSFAPQNCSDCESTGTVAMPLQLGKDQQVLSFSQVQQRIFYKIPWKDPAGQGVPFVRFPANIITQGANQPLDVASFEGSLVVIGSSFGDAKDIYPTPLGESPGGLILLNAIYSLLQYGELRSLPVWLKLLIEVVLILGMSLAFIRFFRFWGFLLVSLLTYLPVIILMVWIYRDGMWVELDVVFPLFAVQLRQGFSEWRMASEFKMLQEQLKI